MAQRIVGLDVGTSAIRAVELHLVEGALPMLQAYGQVGIPHGAVVDGEIRDRAGVAQAITRLWREGGFVEKRVLIGVAGLRAITRELDMPRLPPDELNDAVRFQADEVVPFPLERTAISTKVIAQYTNAEGSPTLRVLVAAAHLDLIDALVDTVQQAGLQPAGIDLNTAALVRSLYDPAAGTAPEAIVSVGAGLTMVVIHQAGVLQFLRTIDLGGESITRSIGSALDLPLADAEDLKRRLAEPVLADERARDAADAAIDDLVTEVHNSIRFFASLPGRSAVSRLLVTGGGARVAGFFDRLAAGVEVPILPASPLSRVDTSQLPITPEQVAAIDPTIAVPVGLALPDPTGAPFNLLPREITERIAMRRTARVLAGVGAFVLLALIALTVWRVLAVNNAAKTVTNLQATVSTLSAEIPKYDHVVQLEKEVATDQKQLGPTLANQIDILVVLNQLGLYEYPPGVLSTITIDSAPASAPSTSTGGAASSGTTAPGGSAVTRPVLGTLTTAVAVPSLPAATQWVNSMLQAPAFSGLTIGGVAQNGSGYGFAASMSITAAAFNQTLAQYAQPVK